MNPDRLEKLVMLVLEETRAFRQESSDKIDGLRQEMNEKFAAVDEKFAAIDEKFAAVDEKFAAIDEKFAAVDEKFVALHHDLRLVQTAVLETSRDLKRVESKLDRAVTDHDVRLTRLEGAAE